MAVVNLIRLTGRGWKGGRLNIIRLGRFPQNVEMNKFVHSKLTERVARSLFSFEGHATFSLFILFHSTCSFGRPSEFLAITRAIWLPVLTLKKDYTIPTYECDRGRGSL